jgi:hypothetical protein
MQYAMDHPEVCEQQIRQPIIILGFPRTGTTLLYNLIALDPATRAPRTWEMSHLTGVLPLSTWYVPTRHSPPAAPAACDPTKTLPTCMACARSQGSRWPRAATRASPRASR